jgi:hypothetical protein
MRAAAAGGLLAALLAVAPPLVLECAACHGFDGVGQDDGIPNLAGQHCAYLDRQLLAFRSGAGASGDELLRSPGEPGRVHRAMRACGGLERHLILINAPERWVRVNFTSMYWPDRGE